MLVGDHRQAAAVTAEDDLRGGAREVRALDLPHPLGVGLHRVEVVVAKANGVAAGAVEVCKVETGRAVGAGLQRHAGLRRERGVQALGDIMEDGCVSEWPDPAERGDVVTIARSEGPGRAVCGVFPVVERDNGAVVDTDDVVEVLGEEAVNGLGRWTAAKGIRLDGERSPGARVDDEAVALIVEWVVATTGRAAATLVATQHEAANRRTTDGRGLVVGGLVVESPNRELVGPISLANEGDGDCLRRLLRFTPGALAAGGAASSICVFSAAFSCADFSAALSGDNGGLGFGGGSGGLGFGGRLRAHARPERVGVVLVVSYADTAALSNLVDVFDDLALVNPGGAHLLHLEEESLARRGDWGRQARRRLAGWDRAGGDRAGGTPPRHLCGRCLGARRHYAD